MSDRREQEGDKSWIVRDNEAPLHHIVTYDGFTVPSDDGRVSRYDNGGNYQGEEDDDDDD
ncbi:MAG: hypothetical protein NTZ18_00665 [Candidatus Komeilibacteria bacterium]|nr:hypothetical protein [Candidatus Komeilibacteria bacterium]